MQCNELDHDDGLEDNGHGDDEHEDGGHDADNFYDAGMTRRQCPTSVNTTTAPQKTPYVSGRWPRMLQCVRTSFDADRPAWLLSFNKPSTLAQPPSK